MNRNRRLLLFLFVLLLAVSSLAADSAVDILDGKTRTVSVPLGTDNGVSRDSLFEIVLPDNSAVRIHPAEIYGNRFWCQRLSREEFDRIRPGMSVRTAPASRRDRSTAAAGEKTPPAPERLPPPPQYRVDLKNDAAMVISVPIGTDNGVTLESDFEVVGEDNTTVLIYPQEIYGGRFWSQPLSPRDYGRIRPGMTVWPSALSGEQRARVRAAGQKRLDEIRAKREEARREAARRDIDDLRKKKAELEDQRDSFEDRIAAAEKNLASEEERGERQILSEDRDIDLAMQKILDLADRRDELQERRLSLSGDRPIPRDEIARLTAEIKRLNDRIESERGTIRIAQDRKRSARYTYFAQRKEWKELVAERRRIEAEIRTVDRKIQELAASLR